VFELQKTELKNNRILSNNITVNWVSTLTMPSYFFKNKINIELIEKQRNASNLFTYDRNHLNLSLKLTKFWRLILTKKIVSVLYLPHSKKKLPVLQQHADTKMKS